jgi:fatty-acyl-CoA synthase
VSTIPGIGYWSAKAALLHPERTALVTPEGEVSYGELERSVSHAAALLRSRGVGAGDRVGILMLNDRRFLELLFASGRIGAIAVPLNWRLTAEELAYQVNDAGIRLLLVGPEHSEPGYELAARCGCDPIGVPEPYDSLAAATAPEPPAPYLSAVPGR